MPGTAVLTASCTSCNTTFSLTVTREGYDRWRSGAMAQSAFPELSADERELLISRTCGPCFDAMFGGE